MKTTIFTVLLLVLSSGAQARTVSPEKSPSKKPPLEVFIPSGWQMEAPWSIEYSYSAKAALLAPGADPNVQCRVKFREETTPEFRQSNYQARILNEVRTSRSNFNVLNQSAFPIEGREATRVTASWNEGGRLVKGVFYFLSKAQRKVVMECVGPSKDHERLVSGFDQIAQRLKIH